MNFLKNNFKYNIRTKKWTNLTSVPLDGTIKFYNYAVVVYGKDLLYFGGRHSGNSIYKYQLNTDTWKVSVPISQIFVYSNFVNCNKENL